MLSDIPALDSLLRRSERVGNLQSMLSQADLDIRAGNMLLIVRRQRHRHCDSFCYVASGFNIFGWVGALLLGASLPYSYASYRRIQALPEV